MTEEKKPEGESTPSAEADAPAAPAATEEVHIPGNNKGMNRNPFVVGLWTPLYLLVFAVCVSTDFLWAALFFMFTLALLGAYVTEFEILPGIYTNEIVHKVAVSALFGILIGFVAFLIGTSVMEVDQGADSSPISPAGKMGLTWVIISLPAYLLSVFLIFSLNKRDLLEEHRQRQIIKAKRKKSGGPPIMNKDGGGL